MSYDQLETALKERDQAPHPADLSDFIEQEHAADLARFVAEWPPQDAWRVLDLLDLSRQAEVFGYLPHQFQVDMADSVARDRLARLVTEMNSDERADLYNELSEEQRAALLPAPCSCAGRARGYPPPCKLSERHGRGDHDLGLRCVDGGTDHW